jgi:medium-chain acyl-[acyl-carrier-protein] hydrolase
VQRSDWITRFRPRPEAGLTLLCFPYSGVGPSIFRWWADAIQPEIDLWAVALPGHESRLRETPFSTLEPLVSQLGTDLAPRLAERPFAIFGHSLGALIGFEVARWLEREHGLQAVHFFASGAAAPRTVRRGPAWHELPDHEFVAAVQRRYGGIPRAVLGEPDFLELLVPALRADFTLFATYRYDVAGAPLRCPILVLHGREDGTVTADDAAAWKAETSGGFGMETIPGGHLFLAAERDRVLRAIEGRLSSAELRTPPAAPRATSAAAGCREVSSIETQLRSAPAAGTTPAPVRYST